MKDEIKMDDVKKILKISNDYIVKFINIIDPKKYESHAELFMHTCLTGPCVISATFIDKISVTFKLDKEDVLRQYIYKLNIALKLLYDEN